MRRLIIFPSVLLSPSLQRILTRDSMPVLCQYFLSYSIIFLLLCESHEPAHTQEKNNIQMKILEDKEINFKNIGLITNNEDVEKSSNILRCALLFCLALPCLALPWLGLAWFEIAHLGWGIIRISLDVTTKSFIVLERNLLFLCHSRSFRQTAIIVACICVCVCVCMHIIIKFYFQFKHTFSIRKKNESQSVSVGDIFFLDMFVFGFVMRYRRIPYHLPKSSEFFDVSDR